MPLEPGSQLYNRYRILAELGRGGMGAVYHANDDNLAVEVAIKENLFVSPQFAQQFRREATLLAGLRHPSLPRVTDHFVISGQGQYLVMDFIPGDDAGRRLKRQNNRPLPEPDVLAWIAAILDALHYLHTRQPPVVHRDIKPGNIKITPDGLAVLVDFGLAKAQDATQVTATGAKGLSPGYSPPEQYGSGHTDARSDLYSLGATMYALLGGQPPADSLERALDRQMLIPLLSLNPLVSKPVASAIERALSIQADGRFATAADFLAALPGPNRPAAAGAPPPSPPPGKTAPPRPVPPAPRPTSRAWLFLAIPIALILMVLAIAGGAALMVGYLNVHQPATATAPPSSATPVPVVLVVTTTAPAVATASATPTVFVGPTPTPAAIRPSPGATAPPASSTPSPTVALQPSATPIGGGAGQIAFVSERAGPPQIFRMDSDGTHVTQVTHETQGACQPAWSPDGQQLLFVAPCAGRSDSYPASAIYIANADGSGARPFITLLGGAYEPNWSLGGIAFVHPQGGRPQIYVANSDGTLVKDISGVHSGDSHPSWSPDGTRLAFVNLTRSGLSTIYWMFADGTFRAGNSNPDAITRDLDATAPAWSPDGQYVALVAGKQILVAGWDKLGFGAATVTNTGSNDSPAWSADSKWIVFESWQAAANHDIYRMTFAGLQVTPLTTDPASDYEPAWRP